MYRVYFCQYPGAEMKHNSTWEDHADTEVRVRELEDRGFGTEIRDHPYWKGEPTNADS